MTVGYYEHKFQSWLGVAVAAAKQTAVVVPAAHSFVQHVANIAIAIAFFPMAFASVPFMCSQSCMIQPLTHPGERITRYML